MVKGNIDISIKNDLFSTFDFYDYKSLLELENLLNTSVIIDRAKYFELLYYSGASYMFKEDYSKTLDIGLKLLEYSELSNDNIFKMKAHNLIGIANYNMSKYKDALYHYELGIRVSDDERMQAIMNLNISEVFYRIKKYDKAKHYTLNCIKLSQTIGYNRLLFKANVMLANIFNECGDRILAFSNLNFANSLKSEYLTDIDLFYYYLVEGRINIKRGFFVDASTSYEQAIRKLKHIEMKKLKIMYYMEMAVLYIHLNDNIQSIECAIKAYNLSRMLKDQYFSYKTCLILSHTYKTNKQFEKSNFYLNEGLNWGTDISADLFSFDEEVRYLINQEQLLDDSYRQTEKLCTLKNEIMSKEETIEILETAHHLSKCMYDKTNYDDIIYSCYEGIRQIFVINEFNIIKYATKSKALSYKSKMIQGKNINNPENIKVPNTKYLHPFITSYISQLNDPKMDCLPTQVGHYCYIVMVSTPETVLLIEILKEENEYIDQKKELFLKRYLSNFIVAINKGLICTHAISHTSSIDEYYINLKQGLELTQREVEIIKNLYDGCTNKVIGEKMKISPYTVRNHLHMIFTKIGLVSRYELMNYIHERKIPLIYIQAKGN